MLELYKTRHADESTYDSLRYGVETSKKKDYPTTITEMAWSSPIWIKNN